MSDTSDPGAAHAVTTARSELDVALGRFARLTERLWQVSEAELLRLRRDLEATAARLSSVTLAVTREIDSRGAAGSVGAPSTTGWLMGSLRLHPGAASQEVILAESLGAEFAATGAALAAGEISLAAAWQISKAVRALPPTVPAETRCAGEVFLLDQAARLRPDQLQRLGRHLLHAVDPDHGDHIADQESDAVAARALFIQRGTGTQPGMGRIHGQFEAEAIEALLAAIGPLSEPRPSADGTPDPRTPARRRADGLLELVEIAMASGDLPTQGGEPAHVLVTVPLETLQAETERGNDDEGAPAGGVRAAELPDGTPLSAEAARRIACDAKIIAAVLGPVGEILDIGRAARAIPRGIRRALIARDGGCAFPGCDRPPAWCHAHHIWHWARGGPTCLSNLVLLCAHHHRVVHHHGWSVHIGPDGMPVFTPPRWVDPDQIPITRPWRRALDHLPLRT